MKTPIWSVSNCGCSEVCLSHTQGAYVYFYTYTHNQFMGRNNYSDLQVQSVICGSGQPQCTVLSRLMLFMSCRKPQGSAMLPSWGHLYNYSFINTAVCLVISMHSWRQSVRGSEKAVKKTIRVYCCLRQTGWRPVQCSRAAGRPGPPPIFPVCLSAEGAASRRPRLEGPPADRGPRGAAGGPGQSWRAGPPEGASQRRHSADDTGVAGQRRGGFCVTPEQTHKPHTRFRFSPPNVAGSNCAETFESWTTSMWAENVENGGRQLLHQLGE